MSSINNIYSLSKNNHRKPVYQHAPSKKPLAATSHRPNSARQRRLSHQPDRGPIADWSHNHTFGRDGVADFFWVLFLFLVYNRWSSWETINSKKLYSEYEENGNIVTVND